MARVTAEEAIAAILRSMPSSSEFRCDQPALADSDEDDDDPLIDQLLKISREIRTAQHRLRLLLAYAREFQGRRPYPLGWLADATGMSASGVRTAYGPDDVQRVADILGIPVHGRS
jgi:hypothetical protein